MFRILIVDDTKSVHAFVKDLLARSCDIHTASVFNGAEAIRLLQENKNFDLILLDWEMPVVSGPEAFEEFKKMKLAIPTVMMTTKNKAEDIERMLGMGVSEYLMKPFTIDILFSKMESVSGRALPYAV